MLQNVLCDCLNLLCCCPHRHASCPYTTHWRYPVSVMTTTTNTRCQWYPPSRAQVLFQGSLWGWPAKPWITGLVGKSAAMFSPANTGFQLSHSPFPGVKHVHTSLRQESLKKMPQSLKHWRLVQDSILPRTSNKHTSYIHLSMVNLCRNIPK